jgi:hypothetical protein
MSTSIYRFPYLEGSYSLAFCRAIQAVAMQAMPYIDHIAGVGIARGIPNWKGSRSPHSSFADIFAKCAAMGLKLTAHAGKGLIV